MSPAAPTTARSLIAHRPYLLYLCGRGFSEFSYQIGAVAVGWQVYALTGSAFDLGMVGLVQFIPTAILVFVAGHVADRYDRRRVVQICQVAEGLTAAFLAWGSFAGWLGVPALFAAVAVFGTTAAFESPAAAALLPGVAPEGLLQKGTALSIGVWQTAAICGPALGGIAYAAGPVVPYAVMALFWLTAGMLNAAIKLDRPVSVQAAPTLRALFAGVGFVRRNPAILGTISLDLFAVLLGGATALLPIYARDILHTGPWGLGLLRGAPSAPRRRGCGGSVAARCGDGSCRRAGGLRARGPAARLPRGRRSPRRPRSDPAWWSNSSVDPAPRDRSDRPGAPPTRATRTHRPRRSRDLAPSARPARARPPGWPGLVRAPSPTRRR